MGAVLEFLGEGFTWVGELIKHAVEAVSGSVIFAAITVLNEIVAAFQALLNAAAGLLPNLPPVVAPPEFVTAINWFFPLGTLLGIATGLLTGYVAFLGVRWIYRKAGEL